ncbi:28 kDa ribonucleoprotein, chloroplastic-like isoform X1 [Malania oleifera]|uniref:28 kDa ribonucleoprotein, chloroplastic-like isoform X1 n=1 Tax=Malania oleifera TaxID=397392 RepID=UPI0025AE4A53|nr:28 kDa ribonucleoprotein, chloroplastic-like isoform X1 [Malania oleifera]
MTATAVAVGSSFSTAINTLKCIHSKQFWQSDSLLRLASTRVLQAASVSSSYQLIDPVAITAASHRWRLPRISATIAQEEAAAEEAVDATTAEVEEEMDEKAEEAGEVSREGEAEAPANCKLYFGNLPYHCDSAQLAGIVEEYGSAELVEVLYDRDTGRSRGFAFVTMSSTEDANVVIEKLNGSEYGGRTLRVNFSDKPTPKEPLYPESEFKLFIGNLAWSVTSESLAQVFAKYGTVVGARVLYNGETGKSRGYGFVCYSTKSEMDIALESLNGVELEGRAMRVSVAQGKKSSV